LIGVSDAVVEGGLLDWFVSVWCWSAVTPVR
jgi:hypothetical protein